MGNPHQLSSTRQISYTNQCQLAHKTTFMNIYLRIDRLYQEYFHSQKFCTPLWLEYCSQLQATARRRCRTPMKMEMNEFLMPVCSHFYTFNYILNIYPYISTYFTLLWIFWNLWLVNVMSGVSKTAIFKYSKHIISKNVIVMCLNKIFWNVPI